MACRQKQEDKTYVFSWILIKIPNENPQECQPPKSELHGIPADRKWETVFGVCVINRDVECGGTLKHTCLQLTPKHKRWLWANAKLNPQKQNQSQISTNQCERELIEINDNKFVGYRTQLIK